MTEVEDSLRRLLRPVDAPEGFADRLMRALPADAKPTVVVSLPAPRQSRSRQFGIPAALAASLLAAVFFGQYAAEQRELRAEREGQEARRELMQALRLTSKKLDIAVEAVQSLPTAGTEENRS